jgi:hypothetical protein
LIRLSRPVSWYAIDYQKSRNQTTNLKIHTIQGDASLVTFSAKEKGEERAKIVERALCACMEILQRYSEIVIDLGWQRRL